MSRIRTIKPEFFQSETLGSVDRDARLCFVGLMTIADDEGRMRASPKFLAGTLFSFDDDARDKIGGWLDDLERLGNIERYEVEGSKYLSICNWHKHQKIDKPSKTRLPAPPSAHVDNREASSCPRDSSPNFREPSPRPREGSTKASEDPDEAREASGPPPRGFATDLGPRTSDHGPGNGSGTDVQDPSTRQTETLSVRDPERTAKKRSRIAYSDRFEQFWRDYPTTPNMAKREAWEEWDRISEDEQSAAIQSLPNFREYCRNHPEYTIVHANRYLKKSRAEGMLAATPQALAAPPEIRRPRAEPRENPHFAAARRYQQEAVDERDRASDGASYVDEACADGGRYLGGPSEADYRHAPGGGGSVFDPLGDGTNPE